ncbi:hypothetical protein SELMODRAFT_438781 [Selaginella moellendorffii]|uniref:Uncharacterized protein n=1 Tax=Selaginella moellendorffii TaxID=88036 RepID=D8QZE2_SELML|nr:uncharacterized protein LOC9654536 isoform X1 [Selaginella moellendorffii]EFJ34390.1 hypothetical protein SELMODRAFT_438781 [Selaginella moellendorffii]|eukprot:XP_002964057.1 uncharacterized protein LOC9654536 isoform X1 [Selaginella moellendorffii]
MAMAAATMEARHSEIRQFSLQQADKNVSTKCSAASRRLSLVSLAVAITACSQKIDTAQAFSLGTSGPKEWLKQQKKRTADFLLVPIARSRERLESAFLLFSSSNPLEAGNLIRIAARDCIPVEAGSILDLQSRTGVEVCTFRLLVKNAASLLDNSDPVKIKAYLALENLIRSFTYLDESVTAPTSSTEVANAFELTYAALSTFEAGIRACLGIA